MTKLRDKISTLQDLDEFTEYILNPTSNDRIIEVFDPTHIVTEQMIVDIDAKVKGATIERVYEILNGEIEWDDSTSSDEFYLSEPTKVLTVEGINFNIY